MGKIQLTAGKLKAVQTVLQQANQTGIINTGQQEAILELCTGQREHNQAAILLTTGAALIGAAILSFIAANWGIMSSTVRIGIILSTYAIFFIGGHRIMKSYHRTGLSLIYIAMAIFGAGIFLIGQIFNYANEADTAFLLWGAGILPAAFYYKDKIIYHFAILLLIVNICIGLDNNSFPWLSLIAAILPFACYKHCAIKGVSLFFINIGILFALGDIASYFTNYELAIYIFYTLIGITMMGIFLKFSDKIPYIMMYQGFLVYAIAALFITDANAWNNLLPKIMHNSYGTLFSVIFAGLYFISLLSLIKTFNITAPIFICILILRYYFDNFYDFLPKSLFFLIAGLIMLGFGFLIEKLRKNRTGGAPNENIQ